MTFGASGRVGVLLALAGAFGCVPDDWKLPSRVDAGAACALATPTRCGGVCVDPRTDVAHCGACGARCGDVPGGAAACVAGACQTPPRPVAPLSTATVTSRRPTLRWALPFGDGAHLELCRDRALTVDCAPVDAPGSSYRFAAELAPGIWFWRLTTRVGGATTAATGPVWQFNVGARSAPLDLSWGSTLDLNGDGYTDVAVGSGLSITVYVYFGGAGVTALTGEPITFDGPAGSSFGLSMGRAGDVNGDGYADLAVGAWEANRVYVYLGGATPWSGVPITLAGPAGSSNFGVEVASAGDVNGDGYADLAVGARSSSAAYVYLGGAGTSALGATPITLRAPAGILGFGSVAEAGDLNGDGFADVVVGASMSAMAYVYFGSAGATALSAEPITLTGERGSWFGSGVAGAGDVNGDGYADLLVGAYLYNRAFLYLGGPGANPWEEAPITLEGPQGSGLGGVASAGDLDRDGYGDFFVVGGSGNLAQVYLGGGGATLRSATPIVLRGPPGSRYFGSSRAYAGDVNGDGYGDFTVGAFLSSTTYVYLGRAGSPPFGATPITLTGPVDTRYGVAVARAGRHGRRRVVGGG